jgi:hypothetical protein
VSNVPTCIFREAKRVNPQTTARVYSPPADRTEPPEGSLREALRALKDEGTTFSVRFIQDWWVRQNYLAEIKRYSSDLEELASSGRMTYQQAAENANWLRNQILRSSRTASTDLGAAIAQFAKKEGRTLPDLLEKYAGEFFGEPFAKLDGPKQSTVLIEIIRASGRDSEFWTAVSKNLGRLGGPIVALTAALSFYHVYTATDKVDATAREVAQLSAGFLLGTGLGAAGTLCGPFAVICVPAGVFVGQAFGAWGIDKVYSWLKQ